MWVLQPYMYVFILNVIIEIEAQHRFFNESEVFRTKSNKYIRSFYSVMICWATQIFFQPDSNRKFQKFRWLSKKLSNVFRDKNYNFFSLLKFQFHQKSKKVCHKSKIKMFHNVVVIS